MKKYLLAVLALLPILVMAQTHDSIPHADPKPEPEKVDDKNRKKATSSAIDGNLSALFAYNFSGNKRNLTNLTPVVNYGWTKDWYALKKDKSGTDKVENKNIKFTMAINPYVGGQINTRDSSSYIPALMLPGLAGLKIDGFITFQDKEDGFKFILSPVNFGYKLVSNFADTTSIIAQHNIRSSIAVGYGDLFLLSTQYTYGWHNSISESEKNFKTVMGRSATDLQYLNITLQTRLADIVANSPTYLFMEWRGLLNGKSYQDFDNRKIISIGVRSDIGFQHANPAAIGGH